jgi:hypothetical protein
MNFGAKREMSLSSISNKSDSDNVTEVKFGFIHYSIERFNVELLVIYSMMRLYLTIEDEIVSCDQNRLEAIDARSFLDRSPSAERNMEYIRNFFSSIYSSVLSRIWPDKV